MIPIGTTLAATCGVMPLVHLTGCGQQSHLPSIRNEEIRGGVFHVFDDNSEELKYIVDMHPSYVVHLFNNSEVPYVDVDVDVDAYVKNELQFSKLSEHGHDYTSVTSDKKTIVINTYNNSKAVIDYEQQTITFDDYVSYRNEAWDSDNPLALGAIGGEKYLLPITDSVYVKPTKSLVIDLKKYNIPACYADNHGYFPFPALQKVIKTKNISTVVMDISCNGGGTVWADYFLASYLCGGIRQKMCDPITGAYSEYTVHADINGDGKYTEEDDKLPDNIKLFFITSNFSFSCGNMLPIQVIDNRAKDTTEFIGDTTGGGACFTDPNLDIGLGSYYQGSSCYHSLRKDSTKDNLISVESGLKLGKYIENTEENATKFYSRSDLIKIMFEK